MKPKALVIICLLVTLLSLLSAKLNAQDHLNASNSAINRINPLPAINPSPEDGYTYYEFVPWPMMFIGTYFDLSWQPDLNGAAPDGYKLVFNSEPEIDLGPATSWETPWLMEGAYSWQVIPYIIDSAGNKSELPVLGSSKGDAQNCPVWLIYVYADYEIPMPGWFELTDFSAGYDDLINTVTVNWETLSEADMIGYNLSRSTVPDFGSAELLTFVSAANGYGNLYQYEDTNVSPGNIYYYWIEGFEGILFTSYLAEPISITLGPTGTDDSVQSVQMDGINSIAPNPLMAGSECIIQYKSSRSGSLEIYNLKGQLVQSLSTAANNNTLHWDGRDKQGRQCSNGIYFCKLTGTENSQPKRIVIVK
jgi:hypothetical protein